MPQTRKCEVTFTYNPVNDDELQLNVGEIIEIIREVKSHGLKSIGRIGGRVVFLSAFWVFFTDRRWMVDGREKRQSGSVPFQFCQRDNCRDKRLDERIWAVTLVRVQMLLIVLFRRGQNQRWQKQTQTRQCFQPGGRMQTRFADSAGCCSNQLFCFLFSSRLAWTCLKRQAWGTKSNPVSSHLPAWPGPFLKSGNGFICVQTRHRCHSWILHEWSHLWSLWWLQLYSNAPPNLLWLISGGHVTLVKADKIRPLSRNMLFLTLASCLDLYWCQLNLCSRLSSDRMLPGHVWLPG